MWAAVCRGFAADGTRPVPGTGGAHNRRVDERKQAEVEYPERVGEAGASGSARSRSRTSRARPHGT